MNRLPRGKVDVWALYGCGAAMGFTPQQVNAMSVAQYRAAAAGYIRANSPAEKGKLSEQEKADLFDWIGGPGRTGPFDLQTYVFDSAGRLARGRKVHFQPN